MLGQFFSDASRGLSLGKTREENFAAAAVVFLVLGSFSYLVGAHPFWARLVIGTGLIGLALWLGTRLSGQRPPLAVQLATGAAAWVALAYFLLTGGF